MKRKNILYRKGIFCIIYRQENGKIIYLLLKRKLHWRGWEFPKGGVARGENLVRCVKREVKEETGFFPRKIRWHRIRGRYSYSRTLADRAHYSGQSYLLFSAEIKNKNIKIDEKEHSSYIWVDFNKALKLLTWPNQRKCLNIVHKTLTHKHKK
jgi:8-oxo-dGTP pyrophosphatase MutT (NUDIX family)